MNNSSAPTATWPMRALQKVFHVGTLAAQDKSRNGKSMEGAGLSVSLHPQAWVEIAELGGLPFWELSKSTAGQFLDAHQLSSHQRASVAGWASQQGYLQRQPVWRVTWTDCETDEAVYMEFDSHALAQQEHDCRVADEDPGLMLTEHETLRATPLMSERIGFKLSSVLDFDLALTLFAEDVLQCDGVWWQDNLDVARLSAPRGVINLTSLPSWSAKKTS